MGGVLDGRAAEGSRSGRFDHPRVGTGDGNRRRPRGQTWVVFHEVDDALRALIGRHLGEETGVEVAFDAPNSDWAARQSAPTINVFLYDIITASPGRHHPDAGDAAAPHAEPAHRRGDLPPLRR